MWLEDLVERGSGEYLLSLGLLCPVLKQQREEFLNYV